MKPTTKDKNIAIALMLGYVWSKELDGKTYIKKFPEQKDIFSMRPELLGFHRDANLQFEALSFLTKNNIDWDILSYNAEEQGYEVSLFCKEFTNPKIKSRNKDLKEAIFEALYQFSQYIKEKNKKD